MRAGANGPFTDRPWPAETWALLERLQPTELRVTSFVDAGDLDRLLTTWPTMLVHVRPRTGNSNRGTWPSGLLDFQNWQGERTLRDTLDAITSRGIVAHVSLGNEADIELARPAVDDWPNIREATAFYADWFHRERNAILEAYGDRVQIAVTSISQGAPERFKIWKARLQDAGCYAVADFVDEHLYSDGRPLDDPDWLGRWQAWSDMGLPIDVTELNDNDAFATADPHERAAHYAEMVATLSAVPAIRSVSLFTLPGALDDGQKPSWWFLTLEIVDAVATLADVAPAPPAPEPDPVPEPTPMPTLKYEHFTAEQIAAASECPIDAVLEHWPRIVTQLDACGINDRATQIATIGTVAIETASTFRPVREAYYLGEPEPASTYRASLRYAPFYGRGYVQLTWASNYAAYSAAINELWGAGGAVDLIARPDDALDPDIAAAALALYFRDHGGTGACLIPEAARRGDWREVRRLVQGADAGLDRLEQIAAALGASQPAEQPSPEPALPVGVTYDPTTPPERQISDWACSIRSATWLLKSLGVPTDAGQMQAEMVPDYVTPAAGLLLGSGVGLAEVIQRHLPPGLVAQVLGSVTWDELVELAGHGPIAMGSGSLYHWIAVADVIDDETLSAPNPAPNYHGLGDRLTHQQFDTWAPWNAVWVEVTADEPNHEEGGDDLSAAERAELGTLRNLTGNAYHDDGVVPAAIARALTASAPASKDTKAVLTKKLADLRQEVTAVRGFLRDNNPDKVA